MAQTLATASNILKEVYEPGLRKQLDNRNVLANRIEKSGKGVTTDHVGAKYVTFPLHVKRNTGLGARAEMEDLPIPGNQGTVAARIGLKYLYGGMQLSGQALKLVNKDFQAFVSALELESSGLVDDLAKDMNRQYYGNGSGAIATTSTTNASTNDLVISAGMQYIQDDELVDVWSAANLLANTTPKATSRVVTTINEDTNTITLSGAALNIASGDIITRAGSANREITGLAAIVSNTGTLYNVNPSTTRQWKSVVDSNSGTPRPISEGLMIQNVDKVWARGGETTLMLTTLGVRRAYFNLLSQQRKYVNEKTFNGGFTGLGFVTDHGEIPLIADADCPGGTLWGLNEKRLKLYRESPWSFMDYDGSKWDRVPGSTPGTVKDAYQAMMFQYCELGTDRRNTHFKIVDLEEA